MAKKNKGRSKYASDALLPSTRVAGPDDDDLMDDLLAQLDSRDQVVKEETATVLNEMHLEQQADELEAKPKQTAKDRFQARRARKVAALAHNIAPTDEENQAFLERQAKDEEEDINRMCRQYGRQLHQINPDGHCLYSAVADQLMLLRKLPHSQATYVTIRAVAASYIETHADDFLPFLPTTEDPVEGSGLMTPEQFQGYCDSVRGQGTAVWGGEPEIQALSRAFNTPIYVVQAGVPPVVVHDPLDNAGSDGMLSQGGVWLSYHRRLYGLGEVTILIQRRAQDLISVVGQHYNSLRPAS